MNFNNIPDELKALKQWVVYKSIWDKDKQRIDKPPYHKSGKYRLDAVSEDTLLNYDEAVEAYSNTETALNGIGFSFQITDPYTCVDLDNVVLADGSIKDYAQEIVEYFNSYTEYSPSGNGLHIIVKGVLPVGNDNRRKQFEVWSRGKYATMTGNVYKSYNTIQDRQTEVDGMLEKYGFTETTKATTDTSSSKPFPFVSIQEMLAKISTSANADLWEALRYKDIEKLRDLDTNISLFHADGKPDLSQLDYWACRVIAFWSCNNSSIIDQVLRETKLYRKKWDRPDYRERTITKAISDNNGVIYDPTAGNILSTTGPVSAEDGMPDLITEDICAIEFPPLNYLVPELITEGLFVLGGKPKIGKSWFTLELALAVASGRKFLDKDIQQGRAIYFALEDGARRLQNRIQKLGYKNMPNLLALGVMGSLKPYDTGGLDQLKATLQRYPDTRLLIIDTLGKVLQTNHRKDQYQEYTRILSGIMELRKNQDGSEKPLTVILVTHLRKNNNDSSDTFDDILGSIAITGTADATLKLTGGRGKYANRRILEATGRDIEEYKVTLAVDEDTHRYTYLGDTVQLEEGSYQSKILSALAESPNGLNNTSIATVTGLDKKQVSNTCNALKDKLLVTFESNSKLWCLTNFGRTSIDNKEK